VTRSEKEQMQRHEDWITQPVSVLFPKPGVIRMYHNSDCKTKNGTSQHRRRR
jgi:hypothetical protein